MSISHQNCYITLSFGHRNVDIRNWDRDNNESKIDGIFKT